MESYAETKKVNNIKKVRKKVNKNKKTLKRSFDL